MQWNKLYFTITSITCIIHVLPVVNDVDFFQIIIFIYLVTSTSSLLTQPHNRNPRCSIKQLQFWRRHHNFWCLTVYVWQFSRSPADPYPIPSHPSHCLILNPHYGLHCDNKTKQNQINVDFPSVLTWINITVNFPYPELIQPNRPPPNWKATSSLAS